MPADLKLPRPAPNTARVRPYSPGMNRTADLRLSANEGPPPSGVRDLLGSLTGEQLCRYPDPREIESRLARYAGVDPSSVLVTAGADDAIDRVCRAYLCEGRSLVLPSPTFEMFERGAALAGAEVRRVPWGAGPFPVDAMTSAADESTAVTVVVSPDNPSGRAVEATAVEALAVGVPDSLVVLDAAYEEFADQPLTAAALRHANVLVLRTLSKAWSLAGARVGYAIGHPEIIELLRRIAPPYAVSGLSMAVATLMLDRFADEAGSYVRTVKQERADLRRVLSDLAVEVEPSQTNFVFVRHPAAPDLRDAMERLGVLVRAWPEDTDLADALRITVPGGAIGYERLARTLRTVMRPGAVLLDMDGVMVDVRRSYREAIRLTARHFGLALEPEQINAWKAGSDVNNDWKVTQGLLRTAGIEVSLARVTEEFEARYQGLGGRPGLRERESPLCSAEWLAALARRLPVAVVTGRPRADALHALRRFGFEHSVSAVVAMEDAAPKPSPEPVTVALKRLGVETAWMCGDTPDDMRAAQAAGVLPVGVGSGRALMSAGAWRVLPDLEPLVPLLDRAAGIDGSRAGKSPDFQVSES